MSGNCPLRLSRAPADKYCGYAAATPLDCEAAENFCSALSNSCLRSCQSELESAAAFLLDETFQVTGFKISPADAGVSIPKSSITFQFSSGCFFQMEKKNPCPETAFFPLSVTVYGPVV